MVLKLGTTHTRHTNVEHQTGNNILFEALQKLLGALESLNLITTLSQGPRQCCANSNFVINNVDDWCFDIHLVSCLTCLQSGGTTGLHPH